MTVTGVPAIVAVTAKFTMQNWNHLCAPLPRVCAVVRLGVRLAMPFELLAAEVGDELEGAAERGGEPVSAINASMQARAPGPAAAQVGRSIQLNAGAVAPGSPS